MRPPFQTIEIGIEKLRDYCLSETHPRGRHKARVFRSRLGITAADAEWFRGMILLAAQMRDDEFLQAVTDSFGTRYFLDIEVSTEIGQAITRTTWIVLVGSDVLRLTSCYVL
jgi:hypothetical protein